MAGDNTAEDDISILRNEVDKLDRRLWQILSERFDTTVQIRRLKTEITDPIREEVVLKRAGEVSQGLLSGEFCVELIKLIIKESSRIQSRPLTLIGFSGLHGSFGELAVKEFDKNAAPIPSSSLNEVYEAVKTGRVDYAVIPLEGAVDETETEVLRLLINSGLHIISEILIPVRHAQLIISGVKEREIKEIYSSAASLSRCRSFLKKNELISKPVTDMAAAAGMLARGEIDGASVIASSYTAEFYGLEILNKEIDDDLTCSIRYVMIAKKPNTEKGNRCSVFFNLANHSGSLQEVLSIFSEGKINLISIKSIAPAQTKSGKEVGFCLDFTGSDTEANVLEILAKVRANTSNFRVLGCYNSKVSV